MLRASGKKYLQDPASRKKKWKDTNRVMDLDGRISCQRSSESMEDLETAPVIVIVPIWMLWAKLIAMQVQLIGDEITCK
jgi:hypothetical protein